MAQSAPHSPPRPERLVLVVAVAVGLSIMGDSLMYGLLPIEAENLGIALPLVGVLLSANRLVRLASNTWAGVVFDRFGPHRPFVAATVLGLAAAVIYGVGWGFAVFLLARAGWGVAWSALRQGGYQAIWGGDEAKKGRLMGVLWGVVRLGSAISVLAGGFLRDRFGYRVAAQSVAAMTALAIPVALFMRWPDVPLAREEAAESSLAGWRMAARTPPRRWLLVAAFVDGMVEGILVSTAALFLTERVGAETPPALLGVGVGTVAGLLLAVRFSSSLVFGPAIGALSDRLGQPQTLLLMAVLIFGGLAGAIGLGGVGLVVCLAVVFVCASGLFVTLSAASSGLAIRSENPHRFVGVFTTLHDAGLAAGPLLAYSAGGLLGLPALYMLGAGLLALPVWQFWRVEGERERRLRQAN